MEVSEEVMRGRQSWFWRRITLQSTLAALILFLGWEIYITASRVLGWTDVAVIAILTAAIAWLITMYFAMVDNAAKVASVAGAIGEAVGDARNAKHD